MSGSVSDPRGRPPQLKPRRHNPGIGLDEGDHTAIRGDEQIVVRDYVVRLHSGGACAIRLDVIRTREGLVAKNLPVKVT